MIDNDEDHDGGSKDEGERKITVLVKREGPGNLFHSLLEILSVSLTLDVLLMAHDTITNLPYLTDADLAITQIMIMDTEPDDPFYDLWNILAKAPTVRFANATTADVRIRSIILSLPGGSNPIWEGPWNLTGCDAPVLLSMFRRRVLDRYDIRETRREWDPRRPLVVTYVVRTQKRRLRNKVELLDALISEFPDVEVQMVDFAAMGFEEQLRIVQGTHVLAGVHGAGMMHAILLRPGSAIVEILPPGVDFMGFRNVARSLGHGYFAGHAVRPDIDDLTEDWQVDDVDMDERVFVELHSRGILDVYNSRSHE